MLAVVLLLLAALMHLGVCASYERLPAGSARPAAWLVGPLLLVGAALASPGWLVVQKAVALLVMPAGLVLIGLLGAATGALRGWSRRPSRARGRLAIACTVASAVYWLMTSNSIATRLLSRLEHDYQRPPELPGEPLDAILLLGGGTSMGAMGRPQLSSSGDRVALAAQLMRKGAARRVICSGSSLAGVHGERARSLGDETSMLLVGLGVAAEHIVPLPGPRNTREEMAATAQLAQSRGWTRLGLVTSAWHMPRAMRQARRLGLELVPFPADHRGVVGPPNVLDALPSAGALMDTHLAAWELLGMLLGR